MRERIQEARSLGSTDQKTSAVFAKINPLRSVDLDKAGMFGVRIVRNVSEWTPIIEPADFCHVSPRERSSPRGCSQG